MKPKIKKNIELRIGNLLKFENELEAAKNMDIELEEYKKICASITEKLMEEIKKLVDPIK